MARNVLHADLGDPNADITSHDTYLSGFPHAAFKRFREESPVAWVEEGDDGAGFWAITKHADVIEVSRDYKRFTAARGIRIEEMADDELDARRTLMEFDPPDHTRLRRLVQPGFTPKVVTTYEAAFRRLVGLVLDEVLPLGDFDFVTEIARELPIRMLCRLVGVPEEDSSKLVTWGDQMISNADPEYTPVIIDKVDSDEYRLLPFRSPAALEIFRYAEEIALQRRQYPKDDIITTLLTAEPDGKPLTDLEFKNFFTLMMVAGNETTRHTISHGLIYLHNHPDQVAEWRRDLEAGSEAATEEILRASSVTMHFRRTATEDTEIRGVPITAGDKVVVWYTSANYDTDLVDDPFTLDLKRDPNPHITFGTGRHVCLGAALARLEVRVFFEEFLGRVADFEVGEPDRRRSNFISGIKHLPVKIL
ncbi:MAG: cytochrome P450, partial [Actinobacteria bacterium]|nr:cytochrome P450 [Actinomycetota bacterium]